MTPTSPSTGSVVQARQPPRWSLPRGRMLLRALRRDPAQEYLLYIPRAGVPGAPVMVYVHGIKRKATEQANAFVPLCESRGIVLVVPLFTAEMHADYQRLGRKGRGVRADRALNRCLEEVAALTGADVAQSHLLGFSGGAQFAHRYVMAHPHRVTNAVIVAAGWYTFPDPRERFPYGIRSVRTLPGVSFNPEQFLRVPIHVLVGEQDVGTSNVRRTARCDRQQGTTRLERARNWVAAMRSAVAAYGLEPCVTLGEVAGVDHSFVSFCKRGRFIERAGDALFGPVDDGPGDVAPADVSNVVSVTRAG